MEAEPKILFKGKKKCWEGLSRAGEWDTGSGWGRSQGCGLSRRPITVDLPHALDPTGLLGEAIPGQARSPGAAVGL